MKRLTVCLLAVVFLMSPQQAVAQIHIPDTIKGKGFFIGQLNLAKHVIDFFLDKRDAANATKLDSNYIGYYPEKLMFSGGIYNSGGWMKVGTDDGTFNLNSDVSDYLNLRACYRGLSISFGMNPFNMFGNDDTEFDISFYGDKLVFDFVYQNSETMSGTIGDDDDDSETIELNKGFINRRTITLGAMYVFNSRRFSYAAAFDQTCLQKRSCGSVLLGANYLYNRIRVNFEELGNIYMKSKMLGLGIGYGYNFVMPKQWLLSISGLAEVGVWNKVRSETTQDLADLLNLIADEDSEPIRPVETYTYDRPPLIFIPRLAVVHHFGRFFAGFTSLGTMHFAKQDDESNFNMVFVSNLLFGVRL